MRTFWLLTRLRLLDVLRSPSSVGFVLVFPLLLLLVVGFVFAEGHPFERKTVLVLPCSAEDRAWLTRVTVELEDLRLEDAATSGEAQGKLRAREAGAVIDLGLGRDHPVVRVGARDQLFGRGLALVLGGQTSVEIVPSPRFGYVHYLFPGLVAFSVMVSGLFATGYTLVLYRQNQLLKKLATTPLSKGTFVFALIAARSTLVLAQVATLTAVGVLVFGVPLSLGGAFWVGLTTLLGVLAFMGIGFTLACLIKTDDLVVDIVSAVNVPLVFLSEIFFSLSSLPSPLATLGSILPSTAMVRAIRAALLYENLDPSRYVKDLGVLVLWTVASFALGLRLFRWHR
jgi:ABC-2 type transport system permease protein